jgi:hypothetical protein
VAIALTVFGFSLFGDALRDALDPKLREGCLRRRGKRIAHDHPGTRHHRKPTLN